MGKLVATAGHEAVELVARIELRCGVPVKACLLRPTASRCLSSVARCVHTVAWLWSESTILAYASRVRVGRRNGEDHRVQLQPQHIDGFADEVRVAIRYVLKLCRWNPYMQDAVGDVRKARGLEPRLKALPVNLFLERAQNANPLVQHGCRNRNK